MIDINKEYYCVLIIDDKQVLHKFKPLRIINTTTHEGTTQEVEIKSGVIIPADRVYEFQSRMKVNIFGDPIYFSCVTRSGNRVHPENNWNPVSIKLDDDVLETVQKVDENDNNLWNGDKYEWYQFGNNKYGRKMYCKKTNKIRNLTMNEFYTGGIVD